MTFPEYQTQKHSIIINSDCSVDRHCRRPTKFASFFFAGKFMWAATISFVCCVAKRNVESVLLFKIIFIKYINHFGSFAGHKTLSKAHSELCLTNLVELNLNSIDSSNSIVSHRRNWATLSYALPTYASSSFTLFGWVAVFVNWPNEVAFILLSQKSFSAIRHFVGCLTK